MKIRLGSVTALLTLVLFCQSTTLALQEKDKPQQPNVLWLSTEDIGPQLACYGDTTAKTPRLDALAAQGLTYDVAWSNYPVCAPARTTIITGMYAGSLGAGNMRSSAKLPANVKMFPQYLREAGYYCTNNAKEDYNVVKPDGVWDQSSKKADWRTRKPDQPFFAVINHGGTHEGKIRNRSHKAVIDPASVTLPPYWPDVPEVRKDWAQYYDNLMKMDDWIAKELQKLEDAGVADNTIVFFFGDHGSGMPRHKRYVGDSGMRVPFVVHVPEKLRAEFAPQDYQPGGRSQRPIGFVDLAPTMLNVAGIKAPDYMQGQAFLGGKHTVVEPPEFLFGFRERMDERPDLSYSVRNKQFVYISNLMPHLPAGQRLQYQMQTPTTQKWFELFEAGELNAVQSRFWQPRASEELYDLKADPFETKNLASDPQHRATLEKYRTALFENTLKIRDLGFVHEGRLQEITVAGNRTRRDFALDNASYPLKKVLEIANALGQARTSREVATARQMCEEAIKSDNPIVRYWAVISLMRDSDPVATHSDLFERLLDDEAPEVAMAAAETVLSFGESQSKIAKAKQVVVKYCDFNNSNSYYALTAVNIVDRHWEAFQEELPAIIALPTHDPTIERGEGYIERLFDSFKKRMKK